MEILVCARRVPDTSENEIELNSAGDDIERDDLVYSVNEPDNYAVEEALRIVDANGRHGDGGHGGRGRGRRDPAPRNGHGRQERRTAFRRSFQGSDGQRHRRDPGGFRQEGPLRSDPDRRAGGRRRGPGGRHAGGAAGLSVRFAGEFD